MSFGATLRTMSRAGDGRGWGVLTWRSFYLRFDVVDRLECMTRIVALFVNPSPPDARGCCCAYSDCGSPRNSAVACPGSRPRRSAVELFAGARLAPASPERSP